jgi:hypothetical protein
MFEGLLYGHIDAAKWAPIVEEDPLWYLNGEIAPVITAHFGKPSERLAASQPRRWHAAREEMVTFFADRLRRGKVKKGNREEYFNDDDRVDPKTLRWKNPNQIRKVIVHHTVTRPRSWDEYNALGMLRLYVPVYAGTGFLIDDQHQPVSSGHYMRRPWSLRWEEVFWGYHFMVDPKGRTRRVLKDKHTGFNASDYPTNCIGIGVALEGDYSEKDPPEAMIEAVARVVRRYPNVEVIGHREVIVGATGQRVDIVCPGNTFEGERGWKQRILRKLQ